MRRKAGPGTWLAARWKRTPGRIRNRLGQTTWRRRDRRSTTLEPKHPTRAQSPRGREAQRPENHGSKSPETGTGDRRTSRCCGNVQDAAEHSTPRVVPRSPPEPAKARPWPIHRLFSFISQNLRRHRNLQAPGRRQPRRRAGCRKSERSRTPDALRKPDSCRLPRAARKPSASRTCRAMPMRPASRYRRASAPDRSPESGERSVARTWH